MSDDDDFTMKRRRALLACRRCRKKKVKCGAQYPTCSRCGLQHLECVYDVEAPFVGGGEDVKDLADSLREMQKQLKNLESDFRRHQTITVKVLKKASSSQPSPVSDVANNMPKHFESVNHVISTDVSDSSIGHESDALSKGRKRHRSNPKNSAGSDSNDTNSFPSDTDSYTSTLMRSSVPLGLYPAGSLRIVFSEHGLGMEIHSTSLTELYAAVMNSLTQLHINDSELKLTMSEKESLMDRAMVTKRKTGLTFGNNPISEFFVVNSGDMPPRRLAGSKPISQLLVDHLINVYFTCYNMRYPCIDQDDFMHAYRRHSANPLLVNAICALVVKHAFQFHNNPPIPGYEDDDVTMIKDIGEDFYYQARLLLGDCFDIPNITHVQALVLCAYYEMMLRGPQKAQLLHSLAVYMLLEMEVYRKLKEDSGNTLAESNSVGEKEMLKHLFWFVYVTDFQFAYNSGDPAMIDDAECEGIALPRILPVYHQEMKHSIMYFVQDVRLTRIRKSISRTIHADAKATVIPFSTLSTLENTLTAFYDSLPHHLKYDQEKRYPQTPSFWLESMLILNLDYYSYWIELHQFFLPKAAQLNNQDTPFPNLSPLLSLHISTAAANTVTSIIQCLIDHSKCYFDIHAVSAASDIHIINLESPEVAIRDRAKSNLAKNLAYVKRSGGFRHGIKSYVRYVEKLETALRDREMSLELDTELEELDLDESVESQWDEYPFSEEQGGSPLSPFAIGESCAKENFEWIDSLPKFDTHHHHYIDIDGATKPEIEMLPDEELYVLLASAQQQTA
ncbi:fungal-specific transcription factor domain-containing protein [Jimgerdemannia flammicorona]|uniref:Fungal-specific transcription factor domain-containing protein n=1 Tax=Jimgerdemannia flammicorona TaxID=994334 RepID=A0A433D6M7_9FUNG|nr:fungal-specific transcription factor domain-containing protein [Jimgerdemannia flammicorona]